MEMLEEEWATAKDWDHSGGCGSLFIGGILRFIQRE
jgi:hypothetical protein